MKNKKGFTLVELLAVIAILAILVIIALPNVLELFTNARKSAFHTEVREVFKQAQTQYVTDSVLINGSNTLLYNSTAGTNITTTNPLSLQGGTGGNDSFTYCVRMNVSGQATKMKVSNGTYVYTLSTTNAPLSDGAKIEVTDVVESAGVTVTADDCAAS